MVVTSISSLAYLFRTFSSQLFYLSSFFDDALTGVRLEGGAWDLRERQLRYAGKYIRFIQCLLNFPLPYSRGMLWAVT